MATGSRFNPDGLVVSENYAQTMEQAVLPYLEKRRTEQTVEGAGGRPLYCVRYDADAPRGTVMIVHGFTENAFKYAELIHSMLRNGYSVCAYDQRGHGRSWRPEGIDDLSLTHVDAFEEYVTDLEKVVEALLTPMPRPWLLFAHSMGGAVFSLFLERHSGVFARAALCAPMIVPATGGMPAALTALMCRAAIALGKGKKRVFVSKPYAGPEDFATGCATGRERFDWYDAIKAAVPEYQNNGPTYRWTLESLGVKKAILAPGAAERIDIPVRIYTAQDDNSVMPEPQQQLAQRLSQGQRTLVKGARHEIYRSTDAVLFPWWRGILAFWDEAQA